MYIVRIIINKAYIEIGLLISLYYYISKNLVKMTGVQRSKALFRPSCGRSYQVCDVTWNLWIVRLTRVQQRWKTVMQKVFGFLIYSSVNWSTSYQFLHQPLNVCNEFVSSWVFLFTCMSHFSVNIDQEWTDRSLFIYGVSIQVPSLSSELPWTEGNRAAAPSWTQHHLPSRSPELLASTANQITKVTNTISLSESGGVLHKNI